MTPLPSPSRLWPTMTDEGMNYGLRPLLPFDTDDPEFTRGFEAGRLWERMKNDATDWDETVHATNGEMVMRMAEVCEREFRAEDLDDIYVRVFIS